MKPYKFEPFLKTTLWGGYQIAPFKGIFTAQPNIGESWEISGVPGHESRAIERGLIDDVDVGLTLTELIDKYKGLLVGQKVYKTYGNKFPLLVTLGPIVISFPSFMMVYDSNSQKETRFLHDFKSRW